MDKLCHASLVDAARLSGAAIRVFPHRHYAKCAEILARSSGRFRRTVLVTDSVFSMDGDLADLAELARLKASAGAVLVVDDAHGIGVLGPGGTGATEANGIGREIDIITGTLSKALGTLGGFAAASGPWRDYLLNRARPFIFATALPPHLAAAALAALETCEADAGLRAKLWDNVRRLHAGFKALGLARTAPGSAILPIAVGPEDRAVRLAEALLEQGFLVPAVRYPAVAKGKARLRVTLSAAHQPGQVDALLKTLQNMDLSKDFI
jgi:7-keto-8-aminopelargonate synthetase-like enzyme